MGRAKKKTGYNANTIDKKFIKEVSEYYCNLVQSAGIIICADALDDSLFKYIIETAAEFHVTPMKMRKLLITAGVYSTDKSRFIGELHAEGKSASEIQAITGLKKSSINGYLPYSKVIYNHDDKSVGADRVGLYRKRQKLIKELKKQIQKQFSKQPLAHKEYGKIINLKHFDRLLGLIDYDKVVYGGTFDHHTLQIEPTIMDNVTFADAVMQE